MKKLTLIAVTGILSACSFSGLPTKPAYDFYIASENGAFGQANGTLNQSGQLNIVFNGERFVGQNTNLVITAEGSKGSKMTCEYKMPAQTGLGTCQVGNATYKMKFE